MAEAGTSSSDAPAPAAAPSLAMARAALEANPLSLEEHTAATILEISQVSTDEQLPMFADALEALADARGPGSTHPPYVMADVVERYDGRQRVFWWVGQDPEDCVLKEVGDRKSFGLLDTTHGQRMKNLMFLFGLGWHQAGADELLMQSTFHNLCREKLQKGNTEQLREGVKDFLTDAVRTALDAKTELHLVCFGILASAFIATADEGGLLRPDALSSRMSGNHLYIDGLEHGLPWATVSGGNIVAVDVFSADGGDKPVASFVMSAFLHTSALGGLQATNFKYFAGRSLRAHLRPPTRTVRLELRAGASLQGKSCLF